MKQSLKKTAIVLSAVVLCFMGLFFLLRLAPKDMTGMAYADIEAYRTQHPDRRVIYTITIDESLALTESSTTAELTAPAQLDRMIAQAEYLQQLDIITLGSLTLEPTAVFALQQAFPRAQVTDYSIDVLGTSYPDDSTQITLIALTDTQALQAAETLGYLPKLQSVTMEAQSGAFTAETAAALAAKLPDLELLLTFDLFGQTVSTDMERIEYFQAEIGDEGLDTIRSILPLMDKLTYLKLDWCGTSDEATAALRDELAPQTKVVWRVFLNKYHNVLTDSYRIWPPYGIYTRHVECLKYCTEARYIDLGHSCIESIEFVKYMPNLEVLIVADTLVKDLEPLRTCKNLTFLELFKTRVEDLSPLADLPQLEYLNLSDNYQIEDITPLYGLNNLVKLNFTKAAVPKEQVNKFLELHPDTVSVFNVYVASTGATWRFAMNENGRYGYTPRYALLREQIGYDTQDYSAYPKGYITEEITYESTGIIPETK